ncbi:MAG: transglycosylase domain-containing protein [Acidobacteriaceae bacterium]|nr:transglycosylase domain-containing protein [Acidobacteriaceae bacterium]
MKIVLRISSWVLILVLLVILSGSAWLLLDTHGLPPMSALAAYAPLQSQVAPPLSCGGQAHVVLPVSAMGYVKDAFIAAEMRGDSTRYVAANISRIVLCPPWKNLPQAMREEREMAQLRLHFSHEELLSIELNSANFGGDIYGLHNASGFYFRRPANELTISQAAQLAGMPQHPAHYRNHPDAWLTRRNAILGKMSENGSISTAEADAASRLPLGQ